MEKINVLHKEKVTLFNEIWENWAKKNQGFGLNYLSFF